MTFPAVPTLFKGPRPDFIFKLQTMKEGTSKLNCFLWSKLIHLSHIHF